MAEPDRIFVPGGAGSGVCDASGGVFVVVVGRVGMLSSVAGLLAHAPRTRSLFRIAIGLPLDLRHIPVNIDGVDGEIFHHRDVLLDVAVRTRHPKPVCTKMVGVFEHRKYKQPVYRKNIPVVKRSRSFVNPTSGIGP